jgi:ADP-heptose:LPS heptosyltransferase
MLVGERIAGGDPSTHMVEQYLEFARHLGLPAEPRFVLPRDEAARARAAALARELGGAPILLHVGATKPANRWEPGRFGALARACLERFEAPVALTGGPGDREAAARAAASDPRIRDLCGETSLLELAELQRLARAVVSCDSGPMHLAASVGAPVVALFGAADERRTGPYGPRHRVVRLDLACTPCGLRRCPLPRHACMLDLEVEPVVAALAEILARGAGGAPRRDVPGRG